jgi:addiction module HigA family antidote
MSSDEKTMRLTKRRPVSVGEVIVTEFLAPMGLTQAELASAMGVSRKTVNELCVGRRAVTADTAWMLSIVFGSAAEFWLNMQSRNDLWNAMNSPNRRARIEKAKPIAA